MASNNKFSNKHVQVDKANATMVIVMAISSFVIVFSLVASKALISQRNYQARVISKKEKARDQLAENIKTSDTLVTAYRDFVGTSQNILGGNPKGNGDRDGDNAQLILDALPSQYDYPALTTSLEKLINKSGLKIDSIVGKDDQIAQQKNLSSSSPKPVEMPYEITVKGSYDNIQKVVALFESSIRPFKATKLTLSAAANDISLDISGVSYYQPSKNLKINTEVVK